MIRTIIIKTEHRDYMKPLELLYEDVYLKRTGKKTVNRKDISNKLFQITDGGREMCTVFTTRKNDSTTEPSKKAGMEMVVVGRLGSCAATRAASQSRHPELDTKVQYKNNAILRMCVTSIDGKDYTKTRTPAERTRSIDVTQITKIEAGGEVYHIT